MSTDIPKIICINLWSGGHIYVRTSGQKWAELTKGLNVKDNTISGWLLDQAKVGRIITGGYPEREGYQGGCRTSSSFILY